MAIISKILYLFFISLFSFLIKKIFFLFLAALGRHCGVWALCGTRASLFVVRGLSSCSTQA